MVDILKTETVDNIVKVFMDKTNTLCFNPKELGEELKSSQDMKDLSLYWIKELSNENYNVDGRNEYSSQIGKKLNDYSFIKEKFNTLNNPKMELVAKKITKEHKTLQQSFSSVVFYVITTMLTKKELEVIYKNLYFDFYITPMI